jgi:hypothetical protein
MKIDDYIIDKLNEEFESIDIEEATKDMLDESYPFINLGGPFTYMSAGHVLEHYDHSAFREEVNNYTDLMVRDGLWYEFQNNYWGKSAERVADEYRLALQHCDPFQVTGVEHPGWYYYDKMSFSHGPFNAPDECYDHALDQYFKI